MNGSNFEETTVGTPQGGNLSPLLSNIMLNELDKELEKRGHPFVRYADDCNIFVKSEKSSLRVMVSITDFLERKLGLKVNISKSKICRPNEVKFLGFGYYKSPTGYQAIPHKTSIEKLRRKLKILTSRSWSLSLDERFGRLRRQVYGWVNYFRIAKMKTCLSAIDKKVRKRIRIVIWKQWKCIRRRYESLRKLGATHNNAWNVANCRRGYQFVCGNPVIHSAITNNRLEKRGLTSSLKYYEKVHLALTNTNRIAVYRTVRTVM